MFDDTLTRTKACNYFATLCGLWIIYYVHALSTTTVATKYNFQVPINNIIERISISTLADVKIHYIKLRNLDVQMYVTSFMCHSYVTSKNDEQKDTFPFYRQRLVLFTFKN